MQFASGSVYSLLRGRRERRGRERRRAGRGGDGKGGYGEGSYNGGKCNKGHTPLPLHLKRKERVREHAGSRRPGPSVRGEVRGACAHT